MLRPFGPGLPSDAIAHRYGFEGNEPQEAERIYTQFASLGVRSAFAINTFYEEVQGGYYLNRALFKLIDEAMRNLGIFPVILEVWREVGLVPIENEGDFEEMEEYALATTEQVRIGVLKVWQFHAGGGGRFYSDNQILDIILPEDRTRQIVDAVEAKCRAASIRFSREPQIGETTLERSGLWANFKKVIRTMIRD